MSTATRLLLTAASLAGLVLVWQIAALIAASPLLPGPAAVVAAMARAAESGALQANIAITLARVAASFLIAMAIGSAIGIALGRSVQLNELFGPWVVVLLNLPALVVIILCYVWFGLTEAAAITAVAINKIPNVAVTMREGAAALSRDLDEMARVYRLPRLKALREVTLPQLVPFFAASARSGLALTWKIVLVVELLGRSNGVGFELQTAFQLFDVATILAYALAFTAVVQLIELGLLQPWERRANRWRR
ncbi:binding-protein-dependent transport systems inner membrane component [Ancylobacter novellus DSM 506]|uniref:Binding-protein-dependent transport systems inner membrane component n=1 Tax=Ancylobacter novellus (strain ATCC 8093 / DSM 506 / JCM 20403 / CCM 1077 / IAM 12100 / NBRC 12443 / NCIMB 10456) TaxID=639283 RepID=D7A6Z4_ANCN5|nr:ABC transporter permease [Ancylobacter novellus]ADH88368.1 binding-protein-dependent transport systems inner membrane component [Ancylobacter novellus DSM 506]